MSFTKFVQTLQQKLNRFDLFPSNLVASQENDGLSLTQTLYEKNNESKEQSYIIFLEDNQYSVEDSATSILQSVGVNHGPKVIYEQLNGFAVNLTQDQAQQLKLVRGVKVVEPDTSIVLEPPVSDEFQSQTIYDNSLNSYDNIVSDSGEVIPWGVQKVWQGINVIQRGNFAADSYAFVIDSGVLSTTGDLSFASNSTWHRSWVFGETPFTDGNGHGTHVAGTIGALVNGKGVIGVAPGAQIVSLKVFDSSGGGASHTTIIEAINHAVSIINGNSLDKNKVVINMSLSGSYSPTLDLAIKNAADQGIRFCVAAGNNGQDADGFSPASAGDHPNVYTVSAIDSANRMTFWSNWDRLDGIDTVDDVDYAAPGSGILSYYKNGQLANLSGTSMAVPHVAGLLITGGVQAGDTAIANYANTADPIALSLTQTYTPSPVYNLSAVSSVNEGQTIKIDISTANVPQGTSLFWQISGKGINLNDFVNLADLRGSVALNSSGIANVEFRISEDKLTEGSEIFAFELFSDSNYTKKVSEKSVSIQDTSIAPITLPTVFWGTLGNDTIIGTAGRDILTGVLSSGTSLESLGKGQIDTLTGSTGNDVFVLGDARGVFYDDGIVGNLGTKDYALIKDFKIGEDKIQLKNGNSYLWSFSNGNLSFYSDRNRNRILNTTGVNQDELIAVLEGVSTLTVKDLIQV